MLKAKFRHIANDKKKQDFSISLSEPSDGLPFFTLTLNNKVDENDGTYKCDKCSYYYEKAKAPKVHNCDGNLVWDLKEKWHEQLEVENTIKKLNGIFSNSMAYSYEYENLNEPDLQKIFLLLDEESSVIFVSKLFKEVIFSKIKIAKANCELDTRINSAFSLNPEIVNLKQQVTSLQNAINVLQSQAPIDVESFKKFLEENKQMISDQIKETIQNQQLGNISTDVEDMKKTVNLMSCFFKYGMDFESIFYTANRRLAHGGCAYTTSPNSIDYKLQYDNKGNYIGSSNEPYNMILNEL